MISGLSGLCSQSVRSGDANLGGANSVGVGGQSFKFEKGL